MRLCIKQRRKVEIGVFHVKPGLVSKLNCILCLTDVKDHIKRNRSPIIFWNKVNNSKKTTGYTDTILKDVF